MEMRQFSGVLAAVLLTGFTASAAPNLVRNGDFETGNLTHWDNGRDVTFQAGPDSRFTGFIDQTTKDQQGPGQTILLTPDIKKLQFSWRVKVSDLVIGEHPWQTARLVWQFQNAAGVQVGNWDSVDVRADTDWRAFSKTVAVPAEAVKVAVYAGIDKTGRGRLWFDNIRIEAVDTVPVPAESRTDTTGWYPLETVPVQHAEPPVTDLSFLLDAPAGKHGFLQSRDGHFQFADGTRIKFWGVNYGGGDFFKTSKADTDALLDRLARSGCNMVRLHQLDATYRDVHIFGSGTRPASTRQLSPERLDQLDYFIDGAKKRGIYIYLDLLTGRVFGPEDGVADYDKIGVNAAIVANFDPRIIELQKEFANQLLTHRNSYTGARYVDEPAIALSEIVNESTVFDKWRWPKVPQRYQDAFLTRFDWWCTTNHLTRPAGGIDALFANHDATFARFLREIQTAYFTDMRDYLRGLGVRYSLAGTNWQSFESDLLSNATLDFIDRHVYWDHPTGGWSVTDTFTNQAMVQHPAAWQAPGSIARNRIQDKPFVLSEWNNCRANEYLTEGPLLMTSTAAFQNWDGLLQFSYKGNGWNPVMRGVWNIGEQPQNWAPRLACALLFLRGDLAPAPQTYVAHIGDPDKGTQFIENNLPPGLAYLTGIAASENATPSKPPPCPPASDANALYKNAQGLSWQSGSGIFTLDTERTQAVLGFTGGQRFQLGAITVTPSTKFCQLILSSLDGRPLRDSRRMLLTATARAENTSTVYNGTRTSLKNEGTAPILLEPVTAALHFEGAPVHITPLDHSGYTRPAELKPDANGNFQIGSENSFWYEVTRP